MEYIPTREDSLQITDLLYGDIDSKQSATFYKKICEMLTLEERLFLLKNLENKDCTTCLNGSCRVETSEKIGLDEFGKPNGTNCSGWYNAEIIGKSKVLRMLNVQNLK